MRRRTDPAPDLGQDCRRSGFDLLAFRRRSAADDTRQDHRRSDPTGAACRRRGAGDRAAPGIPARLSSYPGHRVRAEQRSRDDERLRADGACPGRPGCAAPAGHGSARRRAATSVLVDLPTGVKVKMYPGRWARGCWAGGVIHAKVAEASRRRSRDSGTAARMLLPGIVGSGALWRRACDEVEDVYRAGEWVALAGEPGVGKLAILRAVHQRRNPGGRFTVLDAADATDRRWLASARRALVDENGDEHAGSVVIRHPDRLDGVHLRSLTAALQEPTNVDGKRSCLGRRHARPRRCRAGIWLACCDFSRARWTSHRCVTISRTSSNSRPSSSRGSATRAS